MEATFAWALRPLPLLAAPVEPPPRPSTMGGAGHEIVLIVVSVPGGDTTLTRMTRTEADAAVRADSPAILGSVITPEGRTIYVRDAVRDALAGRATDGPVTALPLRTRGDALLDVDA